MQRVRIKKNGRIYQYNLKVATVFIIGFKTTYSAGPVFVFPRQHKNNNLAK